MTRNHPLALGFVLLLCGCLLNTALVADDEPPPAPVGVTVTEAAPGRHVDAVVGGRLLGSAFPRTATGVRDILLLVAREDDPDGPRHLLRLDPTGAGALRTLARDLPATANSLAAVDDDGDGRDHLLLGLSGSVERLTVDGDQVQRQLVWAYDGLDLRGRPTAGHEGAADGQGTLLTAAGLLAVIPPGGGAPATIALPQQAQLRRAGLRITTPPVTVLPGTDGQGPLYAVGPEAIGPRRLRTLLLDPAATDPEKRTQEAWALLPSPERVMDSWYMLQDGRPRLVVTTINAEKMVVLGRKRLRTFPLLPDRTRQGKNPSSKTETTSRQWQAVAVTITDADGDGKDDMTVLQYDGLGGGKMAVEIHPGLGAGRYAIQTRRTVIDNDITGWHYGTDFDADGEPDLLLVEDRALYLHRGATRRTKRRAVEARPTWNVVLSAPATGAPTEVSVGTEGSSVDPGFSSRSQPQVLDLDHDQRSDIILQQRSQRGRGRIRLIYVGDASAAASR